jgi:hypothetical protein
MGPGFPPLGGAEDGRKGSVSQTCRQSSEFQKSRNQPIGTVMAFPSFFFAVFFGFFWLAAAPFSSSPSPMQVQAHCFFLSDACGCSCLFFFFFLSVFANIFGGGGVVLLDINTKRVGWKLDGTGQGKE